MSNGVSLLLTGVTGFVGKVVLESLIRRRNELNIKHVYVIIREKTNRRTGEKTNASDRFDKEVASSECFSALPLNWKSYVKVVSGDLTEDNLGFDNSTISNLQNDLTHIINCAASVEFDLPIAEAAASNITSALNVLKFASGCLKLASFVNVSTAYVSPHPGAGVAVPEQLVNLPFDPEEVYQSILNGTADEKALMAKTGHPNTYTFTKCLSEHLITKYKGNVPLAIVRPSIISASWQYPKPGWIDSYAAFAGFVSLIGLGLLKCVSAVENTVLDIVPCDEVSNRIIETTFWSADNRPYIQHIVTGVNRGCRIDTCNSGIESYFQRHPVQNWSKLKAISNGKPIHMQHMVHHVIPSKLAKTYFSIMKQDKKKNQVNKLLEKIEYLNRAFPYFTHNSFYFEASTPLQMPLDSKQYIELVCKGVHENLMKNKASEITLAGFKHKHPKKDLHWVNTQPKGNWAIRTAAYVVKKALRKCTDRVTFDHPSFDQAMTKVNSESLLVVIPNHRSYMDFLLCSYLFFSHPELNIPIPQIAAANEFARLPFLGWFFQQTHAFYIKRGQGKEDPELKQKIQGLVDKNQTLEFFIEGTRSRSRQFLRPKRGLLRALQNTGIPCTILPVSISYDLVPEEKSFLSELKAAPKEKMKLSALLKWTNKMIKGQVKLGRVHIACGEPVIMNSDTDVHKVSNQIMHELQDKSVVSDFHLKAFLHNNPIKGIDLEWLKNAIKARGGRVIDSPLDNVSVVDPLTEKTMRYHWLHYFYQDILSLWPEHPVFEYHINANGYNSNLLTKKPSNNIDPRLITLLRNLFEPLTKEYLRVLDIASDNNGKIGDATALMKDSPDSFLPFVEEVLSALLEHKIIKPNTDKNGFVQGENWYELNSFYTSCQWDNNLVEAKSA